MYSEPETVEETRARLAAVGVRDAPPRPGRTRVVLALVLVAVVALAGVGVAVFFFAADSSPDWSTYPGSAYRDSADVLAGDTLEDVVDQGDSALSDFRAQLSEQLGVTWTQVYDETVTHDYNYYGGQSLLYFWDSGTWRGSVQTSDPDARQKIQDLFAAITTQVGATSFTAWNDLVPAGDPVTLEQYGLGDKPTQALWSLLARDDPNGVAYSADVYDSSIPVGDTFTGADRFDIVPGDDATLYVTVFASAPSLLSERDRDTFLSQLKPYDGREKPAPTE